MIKNISLNLGMRASCRGHCSIENKCMSINIGPPINDKVLCQLSDSDNIQHPNDLKPRDGYVYRGTEVGASLLFSVCLICLLAHLFSCGLSVLSSTIYL